MWDAIAHPLPKYKFRHLWVRTSYNSVWIYIYIIDAHPCCRPNGKRAPRSVIIHMELIYLNYSWHQIDQLCYKHQLALCWKQCLTFIKPFHSFAIGIYIRLNVMQIYVSTSSMKNKHVLILSRDLEHSVVGAGLWRFPIIPMPLELFKWHIHFVNEV